MLQATQDTAGKPEHLDNCMLSNTDLLFLKETTISSQCLTFSSCPLHFPNGTVGGDLPCKQGPVTRRQLKRSLQTWSLQEAQP